MCVCVCVCVRAYVVPCHLGLWNTPTEKGKTSPNSILGIIISDGEASILELRRMGRTSSLPLLSTPL